VDPVTGTGTVNLKGKLTFKKGSKKVVYKKLTAKIGSGGYIKGKAGKVFKLKGGTVTRNGFGANVTGVKLSFLKGAAKAINKKLGLHSLHKGQRRHGVGQQRAAVNGHVDQRQQRAGGEPGHVCQVRPPLRQPAGARRNHARRARNGAIGDVLLVPGYGAAV